MALPRQLLIAGIKDTINGTADDTIDGAIQGTIDGTINGAIYGILRVEIATVIDP
jgi:hypothetical protein